MSRFAKLFRATVIALAALTFGISDARADLITRVTTFDSGGNQLQQSTAVLVLPNPMTGTNEQNVAFGSQLGGFEVVTTDNISTSASGSTDHSLTINLRYSGPTGVGTSNSIVIEFLGTNYVTPISPPDAVITSNGSPSTSGLQANSLTMVSGVSVTNAGLPGTPGDTTGLSGTTTGTGSIGSASSVLMPNPVSGAAFAQTGTNFSFYQAFTYDDFLNSGSNSLSAGTLVTNVPAPAGLLLVLTGIPMLGVGYRLRRRNVSETAVAV